MLSQQLSYTPAQQKILDAEQSQLIHGIPGSGKTTVLLEKARRLASQHGPEAVGVVSFTYRGALYLQQLLNEPKVKVGTLRDFAIAALSEGGQAPGAVIDNTHVRQILRRAMDAAQFEGTLNEAEHILRRFKGRPKAPQPEERYYGLARAYRQLCEDQSLTDRHDVVRQHLLGISQNTLKPLPFKYLIVDNLQDVNALQLIWLKKHLAAGTQLFAALCTDITLFAPDGALGADVIDQLKESLPELPITAFGENLRSSRVLVELQEKTASLLTKRPLAERYQGGVKALDKDNTVPAISARQYHNKQAAFVDLLQQIEKQKNISNYKIGIILRHDYNSNQVAAWLKQHDQTVANLSLNVWDTPGAQVLLDLLAVLLNLADDAQLRRVLQGYGLPPALVSSFFTEGLVADDWLKRGAPLPDTVEVPTSSLSVIGTIQRRLGGGWRLMASKQAKPREVFKSAAHDLLTAMPVADQQDALLALNILLHLKGRLAEVLPNLRRQQPYQAEAMVTVLPVREARNLAFDEVWIMGLEEGHWPATNGQALGVDSDHERRLLLMAQSRASQQVVHVASDPAGPYWQEASIFAKRKCKK